MFENMIYGKSLNVLTEYQTLLFLCIYQFAVVDLGEGPGTLPPLFWVGSVGLGRCHSGFGPPRIWTPRSKSASGFGPPRSIPGS